VSFYEESALSPLKTDPIHHEISLISSETLQHFPDRLVSKTRPISFREFDIRTPHFRRFYRYNFKAKTSPVRANKTTAKAKFFPTEFNANKYKNFISIKLLAPNKITMLSRPIDNHFILVCNDASLWPMTKVLGFKQPTSTPHSCRFSKNTLSVKHRIFPLKIKLQLAPNSIKKSHTPYAPSGASQNRAT
jgi:hypothetical protein